jgi:DNA-binding LacI/PurR family transcriptional regulator
MSSGQPLYLRIKDRIRAEILFDRGLGPGSRLPTERELQQRFGVSRPTIAKALAALASEGEVFVAQGRGRYASAPNGVGLQTSARRRIGYVATIATETLTQRACCGIERAARRLGYGVVMASANNDVRQEREAVHDLIASGICGLIIYPVPRSDGVSDSDYLTGEPLGVPVVLIDTPLPEHGYTQFVFDNEKACYTLTSWLIEHGHTSIAYTVGDAGLRHGPLTARLRGYRNALADHGVPEDPSLVVHYPGMDLQQLRQAAVRLAESRPRPTAVIATDDMGAMVLIEQFATLGISVPEDIHIVGFDDREEARRMRHQFSTTRPDFERLGEGACEELVALVAGESQPNRTFVYDVPLVFRRRTPALASEVHADELAGVVLT